MNAKRTTKTSAQTAVDELKAKKAADEQKAKEIAAAEAAEQDRIAAEQAKMDPNPVEPSEELAAAAKEASDAIEAADRDEVDEGNASVLEDDGMPEHDPGADFAQKRDEEIHKAREEAVKKSEAAYRKLMTIATDFQKNTPDEFPVFGRAGIVFTLGDLRHLLNLR